MSSPAQDPDFDAGLSEQGSSQVLQEEATSPEVAQKPNEVSAEERVVVAEVDDDEGTDDGAEQTLYTTDGKQHETAADKDDEEEEDDDDFGSFSDASFDEFEQDTVPEEPTNENKQQDSLNSTIVTKFPQSVFSNEEQLRSKLEELAEAALPGSLEDFEPPQNICILNKRSEHLLEELTSQIYLKPYNWKKSSMRRQLLVTLGLPDIETSSRVNQYDAEQYLVKSFEELHINEKEKDTLIDRSDFLLEDYMHRLETIEALHTLSEDELNKVFARYSEELQNVEKLLSIWENEKVKLQEDNNTFEGVVENLVGHTQRLRREETFKSLKKAKEKSRGIGSIFRKKKK